jgi:D-hexose-6-phosphate mutarotase
VSPGGHGGGVTPVPIPNTAVKTASADGTWGESPWESRTLPGDTFSFSAMVLLFGVSLLEFQRSEAQGLLWLSR